MNMYLLDDLNLLQAHLSQHFHYHQVVKDDNEQTYWQQIKEDIKPGLIKEKPVKSAKSFFFAEHENVLVFNGEYFQETLPEPKPFVLFGMLSCDLMAIKYQDQFFAEDPYYQARRKQGLLVGLDCISPCQNGFCHLVDAGPGVKAETADLTIHPLAEKKWLLIENTEKGHQAVKGLQLAQSPDLYANQRDTRLKECQQSFPDMPYINDGISKLNANVIPFEFWQQLAIQCIGCSGCTTLCPTCSCYSTRSLPEHESSGEIVQQRFWDSCLYEGFQKEASFHNPSIDAGSRVHRFWYHKFATSFFNQFQRYGCVGCGRCEQTCPTALGVHSVMKRVSQHLKSSDDTATDKESNNA